MMVVLTSCQQNDNKDDNESVKDDLKKAYERAQEKIDDQKNGLENDGGENQRFYSYMILAFALISVIFAISLVAKRKFTRNSMKKGNFHQKN